MKSCVPFSIHVYYNKIWFSFGLKFEIGSVGFGLEEWDTPNTLAKLEDYDTGQKFNHCGLKCLAPAKSLRERASLSDL